MRVGGRAISMQLKVGCMLIQSCIVLSKTFILFGIISIDNEYLPTYGSYYRDNYLFSVLD